MPSDVGAAYDRARDDMALLHSGARLAAKLNAKIIVNGNEFSNAGEMSVDDRHLYHETLEALFTPDIAVSTQTNGEKHSPIMRAVKKRLSQAARLLRLRRLTLLRLAADLAPMGFGVASTTAATLFSLRGHLLERSDETFHLGFFPDGDAHVIWQGGEQSADVDVLLFHCLD